MPGAGPPTPRTGPASPGAAWSSGPVGTPRPTAWPTPGPARASPAVAALARDSSGGGRPSTVMEMTVDGPYVLKINNQINMEKDQYAPNI